MTAQYYGSLPVVRDTGGLHDTVEHYNFAESTGNGFVFRDYDANGLRWAVDEAMRFYALPDETRERVVGNVMGSAKRRFNHDVTARHYIDIYESMLARPLLKNS
jgi:glycogen synthase